MRNLLFSGLFSWISKKPAFPPKAWLGFDRLETLILPAAGKWVPKPLPPAVAVVGTTNTGLDKLVNVIVQDEGLRRHVSAEGMTTAAKAADAMDHWLVEAIHDTGVANDGSLSGGDLRDVNAYIRSHHGADWSAAYGKNIRGLKTGFQNVYWNWAKSRLFGRNAVDIVARGVFQIGLGVRGNQLVNERGISGARLDVVAGWLNQLLADTLKGDSLKNAQIDSFSGPSTGTGLDLLVTTVLNDPSLKRRISTSDLTTGAKAADSLNGLIVSAIRATGVANDGKLTNDDVRTIGSYIRTNSADAWRQLHGQDAFNGETGFHKIEGDGATSRLFGRNAVDGVAEGIYQIGFETRKGRFLNEQGKPGTPVETVATWLRNLLATDLANGSLKNEPKVDPVQGTSQTGLDQIVNAAATDSGLRGSLTQTQINVGATAADNLNLLLLDGIRSTFTGADGVISEDDVAAISAYLGNVHGDAWKAAFADFASLRDHGGTSTLFGENVVQNVATSVYLVGFPVVDGTITQGAITTTTTAVASWLNQLLSEQLANGYFVPNT